MRCWRLLLRVELGGFILSDAPPRPLFTQLQTYRRVALSDTTGQSRPMYRDKLHGPSITQCSMSGRICTALSHEKRGTGSKTTVYSNGEIEPLWILGHTLEDYPLRRLWVLVLGQLGGYRGNGLGPVPGGDPMKKLLVAGFAAAAFCGAPALAADLPMKAPPHPCRCIAGPAVTSAAMSAAAGAPMERRGTCRLSHGGQNFGGVIGGGQVGCDYQINASVVGIAGMFDWSELTGSATDPFSTFFTSHTRVTMLDTATARLGYTFGRSLLYVDGGAAWSTTQRYFTPSSAADCAPATCVTATNTATGWIVGGGWEYLFMPNLSGKIEYDYAGFGSATVNPAPGGANTPYTIKQNISTILVGLNYHFNAIGAQY